MNWTKIHSDIHSTFPPEGFSVLVSDGKLFDVAYYLNEDRCWLKVDVKNDDALEFTAFKPTMWCQISIENSLPKELTKEEVSGYNEFLTVGKLKEFLYANNLPANARVMVQRVEDVYYQRHNWKVYLKKGLNATQCEEHNAKIASGEYLNKEEYPNIDESLLVPATEEEIKQSMEQYTPAFCCARYRDDEDMLFIDMHY